MKLKKRYIIGVILIIAIGGGYAIYRKNKTAVPQYETAKVEKGNIHQIVSATGTITPPSEINLNNMMTGKLVEMDAAIGDKVVSGQVLAKLDSKDLEIKVKEAEASLSGAKSDLNRLLQGAKNEDIAISIVNAQKAEADYKNALKTSEDIRAQVNNDIKSAEDNLKNVKEKTLKDIDVSAEAVKSAEKSLTDAKQSLENMKDTKNQAIADAKESALTPMDTKLFVSEASLNAVYDIINDGDIKNSLSARDTKYIDETKFYYALTTQKIAAARTSLSDAKLSDAGDDIKSALDATIDALNETFNTLLSCYNALTSSVTSAELTQTDLDAYKAGVKAEQTNIGAALSTIQTAKQALTSSILDYSSSIDTYTASVNAAQSALDKTNSSLELAKTTKDTQISDAENGLSSTKITGEKKKNDQNSLVDSYYNQWQLMEKQLLLKKASPLSSEINLYQSRVAQADAALLAAQENLDKAILRAPVDGIITKKNYEAGEQTNGTNPVYSMMVINNYEIEVTISEADIVKIKVGQEVKVTLDAYTQDAKFSGKVIFIEPAQTVIQDVVYYKVKIALDKTDYEIKSGMTANVDIETAAKDNVLIIPQRAVISNGEKKVRVLKNGKPDDVVVLTGIKGEEGLEITDGLNEGEEIIIYEKK